VSHGGGNQERWLLTYSDLITLLMVFFVVMFAISEADKGKYLQLRSSMQRAFHKASVGESPDPKLLEGGGAAVTLEIPVPAAAVPIGEEKGPGDALSGSDGSAGDSEDPRLDELQQALLPLAEAQGVSGDVTVYRSPEGVVISLSGNLLFDSGKADLKPEGVAFLHLLAEKVRGWQELVRIEGHTDDIPINTSLYPSNWELSAVRAIVTTRYLVEHERIPAARVGAAAYGGTRPVAENDTREGRMRNRRVDVLILDRIFNPIAASPATASPTPVNPASNPASEGTTH
jgi:chemotaxis protein MotB